MTSQIYILDNMDDLKKLKDAIVDKLWGIDAVKFNAEYSISLEGHDILTFLHIGMDDPKSHMIENAPYGIMRLFNQSCDLSFDDIQNQIGFLPDMICENYDVDFNHLGGDRIFDFVDGTNQDFRAIYKGEIELVEDFVMTGETLNRLIKIIEDEKLNV